MAPAVLPPAEPQTTVAESLLEFPDNMLLIDLCGEYDRNLTDLEGKLGVQILRRGNQLAVIAEAGPRQAAADILQSLYERLETGKSVEPADIDRAVRMGGDDSTRDGDQIEMFGTGPIEIRTRKKTVEPRTDAQKAYVTSLFKHELAFGIGPAGTGKTYLAVAVGVSMFISGQVDKIILSRPAVEAGEKLGFLPGTEKEKVDPYLRPLYDALNDCMPPEQVQRRIDSGEIEIAPIAFMRGRTLADAFVILDEAQNTTREQMKMFLTRFGQNSRMVVCGDPLQVDIPGGTRMSGLSDAVEKLENVEGFGTIRFTAADVVRHPIVGRIVEAYEGEASQAKGT